MNEDDAKTGNHVLRVLVLGVIVALCVFFVPYLPFMSDSAKNSWQTAVAIVLLGVSLITWLVDFNKTDGLFLSVRQRNLFYSISLAFLIAVLAAGVWRIGVGEPMDTFYLCSIYSSVVEIVSVISDIDRSDETGGVSDQMAVVDNKTKIANLKRTVAIRNGSVNALIGASYDANRGIEPIFWGTAVEGNDLTFKRVAFDSSANNFNYSFAYRIGRRSDLGPTTVPHILLTKGESLDRIQEAADWFFPKMYPLDFTSSGDTADPRILPIMSNGCFADERIVWLSLWEESK